jgi:hypothetical protein
MQRYFARAGAPHIASIYLSGPLNPRTLPLSLIRTDDGRFRDSVLACRLLDLRAGRIGPCLKMVDREREQPEVVVVRPMAMGRTRAAIASFAGNR